MRQINMTGLRAMLMIGTAVALISVSDACSPAGRVGSEPSLPAPSLVAPSAPSVASGGAVATTNVAATPPSGGFYLCGRADLCDDATGATTRTLSTDTDIFGATLSAAGQAVYLLEDRPTTADISGPTAYHITRAGFSGGPEADVVNAPASTPEEAVSLDAAVVSFDGHRLAYVEQARLIPPASPLATPREHETIPAVALGVRIVVIDPATPGRTVTVPSAMAGDAMPWYGYGLIGWSPDNRELYYFGGPDEEIRAIMFDASGRPTSGRLVFHPNALDQSCSLGPSDGTVSPTGDIVFTGYCHPDGVRVYRLSQDTPPHATVLVSLLAGQRNWLVENLAVDTTAHEIAFDLVKVPEGGECVAGGGTVRLLDGSLLAENVEWHGNACPPGTPASPSR